ncbi:MAG: HEAT repeat domain-containing protein [Deltaproteobacteria bacterium]|nr:HEAT repeat domain-containing protein [Deltaproteobacteria bacterium]
MKCFRRFLFLNIAGLFLFVSISLASPLVEKAKDFTLLKTIAGTARLTALRAKSEEEKVALLEAAREFESKAEEIFSEFLEPFQKMQGQIEAYTVYHFILRLADFEKAEGRAEAGEKILEGFSRDLGISKEKLISDHEKLHNLYGVKEEFTIFDENIDILLSVSKLAMAEDRVHFEKELSKVPEGPFKRVLVQAWEKVREEVGKRKILEEEFGSREFDIDLYLQGCLEGKGRNWKYYQKVNELYPELRVVIYGNIRKKLEGIRFWRNFDLVFPEREKAEHLDLKSILQVYVQEEQRSRDTGPVYVFKKVDYWTSFTGSQPTLMPLGRGALFLLGEVSLVGTVIITSTVSAVILGPYGTLGVIAIAALFASAPELNHYFFGNDKPDTPWVQRFIVNVAVMLPLAALFGTCGALLPRTAVVVGGGLMLGQTIHAWQSDMYFEALFSAMLTIALAAQAVKVLRAPKEINIPKEFSVGDTKYRYIKRPNHPDGDLMIPLTEEFFMPEVMLPYKGRAPPPRADEPAHHGQGSSLSFELNKPWQPGGGPHPSPEASLQNPFGDFLNFASKSFQQGGVETLPELVLPRTQPRLDILNFTISGGQNLPLFHAPEEVGNGFIVVLDPFVFGDYKLPTGIFKRVMTGDPGFEKDTKKKVVIIIRRDHLKRMIGMEVRVVDSEVEDASLKISIWDETYAFGNPSTPAQAHIPQASSGAPSGGVSGSGGGTGAHLPKLFLILPGRRLGKNALLWSPLMVGALKSGRYSAVHVIGNLSQVIPPQPGLFVHPFTTLDQDMRPNSERVGILNQTIFSLASKGDTVIQDISADSSFTRKEELIFEGTREVLQAQGVHVMTDISSPTWPMRNVREAGFKIAKDFLAQDVTQEDLQDLYDLKNLPDLFLKNIQIAKNNFFKQLNDPELPYDLYNFSAMSEFINVIHAAEELIKFIELRLEKVSHRNIVIASPFNARLAPEIKEGIQHLCQRFPGRIAYVEDFVFVPYFYEYLTKNAQLFFTPDTGAAHIGMIVNPQGTQVILFNKNNNATPKRILHGWFVPSGNYHILDKSLNTEKAAQKLHLSVLKMEEGGVREEVIPSLIHIAKDPLAHAETRARVVKMIAKMGTQEAIDSLFELLESTEGETAAVRLGKLEDPPVMRLVETLRNPQRREMAADALRIIELLRGAKFIIEQIQGTEEQKEELIELLESHVISKMPRDKETKINPFKPVDSIEEAIKNFGDADIFTVVGALSNPNYRAKAVEAINSSSAAVEIAVHFLKTLSDGRTFKESQRQLLKIICNKLEVLSDQSIKSIIGALFSHRIKLIPLLDEMIDFKKEEGLEYVLSFRYMKLLLSTDNEKERERYINFGSILSYLDFFDKKDPHIQFFKKVLSGGIHLNSDNRHEILQRLLSLLEDKKYRDLADMGLVYFASKFTFDALLTYFQTNKIDDAHLKQRLIKIMCLSLYEIVDAEAKENDPDGFLQSLLAFSRNKVYFEGYLRQKIKDPGTSDIDLVIFTQLLGFIAEEEDLSLLNALMSRASVWVIRGIKDIIAHLAFDFKMYHEVDADSQKEAIDLILYGEWSYGDDAVDEAIPLIYNSLSIEKVQSSARQAFLKYGLEHSIQIFLESLGWRYEDWHTNKERGELYYENTVDDILCREELLLLITQELIKVDHQRQSHFIKRLKTGKETIEVIDEALGAYKNVMDESLVPQKYRPLLFVRKKLLE